MYFAAGQTPEQKGIDRTKRQFAALCPLTRAIDVIQNPGQLGGGKIRVQQQAGFLGDTRLKRRIFFQLLTQCRRPAVLPDNSVIYRLTAGAFPDNGCLALIGNASRDNITQPATGSRQCFPGTDKGGFPDFFRVMLDPTGLWKMLSKLALTSGQNMTFGRKQNGAVTGGSLIEAQQTAWHRMLSSLFFAAVY